MKKYIKISATCMLLLFAISCGNSKKENDGGLQDLKAKLEKERKAKASAEAAIKDLEKKIAGLDPSAANSAKVKLVSTSIVTVQDFKHYIDLHGKVDADNISYISPRMGPAQVKSVLVVQGQHVNKGQLLLKLDDAILRQSVQAARKNLETIKTQLSFAQNIYQRQKNLWEQNIGTEVQVIAAANNVETLKNQLAGAEENIKVAQEQLNTANVYSDVSGVADIVSIRVGETFSGMSQTGPQIKIVNTSKLKIVANVPENYMTRMKRGAAVMYSIPDANLKDLSSTISLISESIDPTMRGFVAEAAIPFNASLKPNQSAIIRVKDYEALNAIVIPVNVVQSDETSKYVYVLEKQANGKTIAQKKSVVVGEVYGDQVEIKAGLTAGALLITAGYQSLYEGQLIEATK